MVYFPAEKSADGIAKVVYSSKDGSTKTTFDVLDWLAGLVVHVLNKYEQLVRYVGYYSNKSRGMRKKTDNAYVIVSIAPGNLFWYCLPVPPPRQNMFCRGGDRERIEDLNFILNISVDKKQVPILSSAVPTYEYGMITSPYRDSTS